MAINLSVDDKTLEAFCRKLVSRSRDIAKTQDSLATLEAFIAVFGKSVRGTSDYQTIETVIQSFVEQSRQQLLSERAEDLYKALRLCDHSGVALIHAPLSRDGFYQILQAVIPRLTHEELYRTSKWALDWFRDARQKAELASGYPDALNFSKAGIDVREYQAMLDVSHCLEEHGCPSTSE